MTDLYILTYFTYLLVNYLRYLCVGLHQITCSIKNCIKQKMKECNM